MEDCDALFPRATFVDGVFGPNPFRDDFEQMEQELNRCGGLAEARAWFERSYDRAVETFGNATPEQLEAPIQENPFFNGPRHSAVGALSDHAAHHRGSLATYARLLGKTPKMPYDG